MRRTGLVLVAVLVGGAVHRAPAQRPDAASTLRGEIVDAVTSAPVSGATVMLFQPLPGVLPAPGSPFLSAARTTRSDLAGAYRFVALVPGAYQLRVQRIGYRPVSIDVELRQATDAQVSVGLTVVPIRLQRQDIVGTTPDSYGRLEAETDYAGAARIAAARARQRQYPSTDVREVTHADVLEAVTLAETDLFRALSRLPGVTTSGDYGAALWTRGGRVDQTRILFDGMPLYDPYHAFGSFSAVDANALGSAVLHPGVRPAALGEGSAGVVDLESRPGGGHDGLRAIGEISLVSARMALDQRSKDGSTAWMLSARRTYLDWLTAALDEVAGGGTSVPYHFADLVGRVDRRLSATHSLEASALVSRDAETGDVSDVTAGNRAVWGNLAGRVTLISTIRSVRLRHTVGASGFSARIDTVPPDPKVTGGFTAKRELPMRAGVSHLSIAGELQATDARWHAGYSLVLERGRFDGFAARLFADDGQSADQLTFDARLVRPTVWGEWAHAVGPRLVLISGLRADIGSPVANGDGIRLMPRLHLKYTLDESTTLSAGAGRSWQYAQAIGRPERGAGSLLYPSRLWLLAGDDTDALRSDMATVGAERWLGESWLAAVSLYVRRSSGMLIPDPRPGTRLARPLFVTARERARGIEVGARRLAGRVTGALAYSYGNSALTAAALSFPSGQDRRHVVDATALWRASRNVSLGAAFSYGGPYPYTRATLGIATVDADGKVVWIEPPTSEAPNARRAREHRSLDLLGEWAFSVRSARATAFVQLRNAFNEGNDAIYIEFEDCIEQGAPRAACVPGDRFERGIPRLPIVGLRVLF